MFKLDVNTDKDLKYIPNLSGKDSFKMQLVNLDSKTNVNQKIVLNRKALKAMLTDAVYAQYTQVQKCQVIHKVGPNSLFVLPDAVNIACCF